MNSCNIEDTIEFLSKKHMLRILKFLGEANRPLRYREINNQLKINSKTLTDRLQELVKSGVINRHSFDEIPPRVEYSLSIMAEDLRPIFDAIHDFENKHVQPKVKPQISID